MAWYQSVTVSGNESLPLERSVENTNTEVSAKHYVSVSVGTGIPHNYLWQCCDQFLSLHV